MRDVKFVAEISSNHNGSLQRCKELITAAAESGCTAVKFQLFKIDELFSPEVIASKAEVRARREWELPIDFIPDLSNYSHDLGLEFSCTPFYLDAVEELTPYVDFFKIASYELLWHDLFRECAGTGLPLVFSTGMATYEEIQAALGSFQESEGQETTILRCTSSYPTPAQEANLSSIDELRSRLRVDFPERNLAIGWSDHTVSPGVLYRAVFQYHVPFIEFHIDLDGMGEEYSAGHCWLPTQIQKVISGIQTGLSAGGDGSIEPVSAEIEDRDWRADPSDGLRPLRELRKQIRND